MTLFHAWLALLGSRSFCGASVYSNNISLQAVLVAHDQIDFPTLGAEIGSEEFEALALELSFGGALAEFAVAEMQRFDPAVLPGADAAEQIDTHRQSF